jgi:hypothetical protein
MSNPQEYSITQICEQKAKRALYNVPAARFNMVCPYPQYTAQQLDMRRKAEILKYGANKTNTKTNNFTKAQEYAMMSNGTSSYRFSQQELKNILDGKTICNVKDIIPTPTSSSDVPGPVIQLYNDPSIPLYNYATNIRSYGIVNPEDNSFFTTYTYNDLNAANETITTLFSLYLRNNITLDYNTYSFETPVSLSLKGVGEGSLSAEVYSVVASVYYNDTLVTTTDIQTQPNTQMRVVYDFYPLSLEIVDFNQEFGVVFYTGVLQITNMVLFCQPGFVYDVKLKFGINVISGDNNLILTETAVVCNVSTFNNNTTNCIVTSPTSPETNSGFVFT